MGLLEPPTEEANGGMLSSNKWFRRSFVLPSLVALVAIIAVVLIALSISHKSKNYSYVYTQFESVKLVDPKQKQTGIGFSKPDQFSQVNLATSEAFYAHKITIDGRQVYLGGEAAARIIPEGITDLLPLPFINATVRTFANPDPKLEAYQEWVKVITTFDKTRLPTNYKVTLGTFKPFTNPNIKRFAWSVDFSATSSKEGDKPIKGVNVLALGNKTLYYYNFSTISENWDKNQANTKKILDSIKIDQ